MNEDKIQTGDGGWLAVRKWDGKKISEPGVYDIPMLEYHGDCCIGPSISSSGIRTILNKSPLHYWDESPLNPNRNVDEDEDAKAEAQALRIGRAAHALMLEPEIFKKHFVTRPAIWDSWRTNDAKKWRATQQKAGLTVMDPAEMERVQGIAQALRAHPLYQQGILSGDIERSIIWQDKKTGVWLKARPDNIPIGSNILADLKAVRESKPGLFAHAAFNAGYDIQLALGGVGMDLVLGRRIEDYCLVPVESKRPHAISVVTLDPFEIRRARSLLRHGVDVFAYCLKENYWPAYEDSDGVAIRRKKELSDDIDRRINEKLLPGDF